MAGQQAEVLTQLLDMTHQGAVFGEGVAFGELDEGRREAIFEQTVTVAGETAAALTVTLIDALPDASSEEVAAHVRQIVPKAAAFMPALTAGELTGGDNTHKLVLATRAVSYMYAADQLIDRGDNAMAEAVRFFNEDLSGAEHPNDTVHARMKVMDAIGNTIGELGGDDASDILDCYNGLVLKNEVTLQAISDYYAGLDDGAKDIFLRRRATQIANLMVADAGFQSVTSSLHTIYQQNDPSLPTIREIHAHPNINSLLTVCNAVARIADERGDWHMDAGHNPEYGKFSINPFNQHDKGLVSQLCRLAGITNPDDIAYLDMHFKGFKDAEVPGHRVEHGAVIVNRFFAQMRGQFEITEGQVPENYSTYLTLCRRVGEICHVNMLGDITMAGGTQA